MWAAQYWFTQFRTSDVAENLGRYLSCTRRTSQVKMETRHPVEGYFGSEFRAICNHCGVMAAWIRKTIKFVEYFLLFFAKATPYGKIFKILFRKFSPRHWSTLLCSNVMKCCRVEIGEIARYFPDKKFRLPLKLSLLLASRPKSAGANPEQCTQSAPNFIQIGSLSAELQPNTWTPPNCPVS